MHSSYLKRRILYASVIDLLSPFCEITKAIMSRGPQVKDMEFKRLHDQQYPLAQMETLLTTKEVIYFQMECTTPVGFQ
jgi:hypothetical protein